MKKVSVCGHKHLCITRKKECKPDPHDDERECYNLLHSGHDFTHNYINIELFKIAEAWHVNSETIWGSGRTRGRCLSWFRANFWEDISEVVSSRKQIQAAPLPAGSGNISLQKSGKSCLFNKQSTHKHGKIINLAQCLISPSCAGKCHVLPPVCHRCELPGFGPEQV